MNTISESTSRTSCSSWIVSAGVFVAPDTITTTIVALAFAQHARVLSAPCSMRLAFLGAL